MWNWFVSRVPQAEMQGLKYSMQMQRISRAERNQLVKVARWNVESFIVGQRPRSYKVAFILQQICDLSTDRRGRAKTKVPFAAWRGEGVGPVETVRATILPASSALLTP